MPYPPGTPDDEVQIKRFVKAGPGAVTLQPIAAFSANLTNNNESARIGYYNPGFGQQKTQLFYINAADEQSVTPHAIGSTSFDPGSAEFSMYGEFNGAAATAFKNADNVTDRDAYQEDQLNTWDTTAGHQQKMRIYPYMDANRNIVPNTYIFIPEDFTTADDNDVFVIIRNVMPAPSGPEFGLQNPDGNPNTNNLVFARQQVTQFNPPPPGQGTTPKPATTSHDTVTVRLRNTGEASELINSLALNVPLTGPIVNGVRTPAWQITNMPTLPLTIPAGSFFDMTIKFVAEGYISGNNFSNNVKGMNTGTLVMTTNDPNHQSVTLNLAGQWQSGPETDSAGQYAEFSLAQTIAADGFSTVIVGPGQNINQGGATMTVGEEVLSPYWNKADTGAQVTVRQIQAYHTEGNTATFGYFIKGSSTNTNIVTSNFTDAQTVFPRSSASGNPPAFAAILNTTTTSSFGFVVDNTEYSDDTKNKIPAGSTTDTGHHMRFWPARDKNGLYIPNTWIVAMDYSGINYDYNDNAYLITNIRPMNSLAAPQNVAAVGNPVVGNSLTWSANFETVTGYNIYRSTAPTTGFSLLTSSPITATSYLDTSATVGTLYYYRVTAVNSAIPAESFPTTVSVTRGSAASAPQAPTTVAAVANGSTAINVNWSFSTNATSYKVLRSLDGVTGWTQITSVSGSTNTYADTNLAPNTTFYYEVIASNAVGDSPASSVASATTLQAAPVAPTNVVANAGSSTQITITWGAVANATGYTIQRSLDGVTGWTAINTTVGQSSTTYPDTGLTPNTTYYYQVLATNGAGPSPASATASATTQQVAPVAPTNALATANNAAQITVTWTAAPTATGYTIQRSLDGLTNWQTAGSTIGVNATSFPDTGLSASTTYYYQVIATNSAGPSPVSNITSATTTVAAPPAPASSGASAQDANDIQVTWAASATATTYTVQRSLDGLTNWTPVFTTPDNNTFAYLDPNLTPHTTYFYQVFATNAGGNSPASPVSSATTPQVAAVTPGTLVVTAVNATTTISLSWGASANADGYIVQRSLDGFSGWTQINTTTGVNSTTYLDNDPTLTANTTYYYQIIATNSVGPSLPGNVAAATTVPVAPSPVVLAAASFVGINVSWPDVAGETGFRIGAAPMGPPAGQKSAPLAQAPWHIRIPIFCRPRNIIIASAPRALPASLTIPRS